MKKLLVLILSAVMLATALTACGESANGQPSGGTGTSDVTVSNTDAAVPPKYQRYPERVGWRLYRRNPLSCYQRRRNAYR